MNPGEIFQIHARVTIIIITEQMHLYVKHFLLLLKNDVGLFDQDLKSNRNDLVFMVFNFPLGQHYMSVYLVVKKAK